ncbi:MAG: IPT/TIG domain-containing protein [Deltaproteobacteria bacterium]|nr:IPT/TIG domain-containing protein [Deltaproteobacteria bacterium]
MKRLAFVLGAALLASCGGSSGGPGAPDAAQPDVPALDEAPAELLPVEVADDDADRETAGTDAAPEVEPLRPLQLTGVVPGSGASAGLETVALAGDGFSAGMMVVFDQTASPLVVVGSQAAANAQTPPHVPGTVDVTVVRPDGQRATLPAGFEYANAARVDDVSPDRVPTTGGVPVVVSGAGFSGGVKLVIAGKLCPLVEVVDDASLTAVVPDGPPGWADVHVSSASGQAVLEDGVYYYEPLSAALAVPAAGPVGGGTLVTLTGTGFLDGTSVRFGGIAGTDVKIEGIHKLTVRTPPAASPGAVDVDVIGPYGTAKLPSGFLYLAAPDPGKVAVMLVSPAHGPASGGNKVAVVATGLGTAADTVVRFGAASAKLVEVSPESLTALVEAPPGAPGKVAVSVESPAGLDALPAAYLYEAGLAVTGVVPASGPAAGGTAVTVTGDGFAEGASVRFGALPATGVKVASATALTAVTPPGSPGPATVTVTSGGKASSLSNSFVYEAEAGLYAVDPDQGAIAGGTLVRLYGSGFADGMRVTFGGNEASHVVVESATRASCRTPAGAMGTVDVRVEPPGAAPMVLPDGFTYYDPTALYGGTWGGPVDGTLNVAVLDGGSGAPLPDAFVIVWTDPKTSYQGFTGPDGVVSFSGPDLAGTQMVSANKDCYDAASVVAFDAKNVTLYLSFVCAQGGGMPPGGNGAMYKGKVVGLDKYVIPPPGNCWLLGTAPDGIGCLPCWGDDTACGEGNRCLQIADDGQFCSRACSVPEDCPEGYGCVGTPGGFVGCMPLPGRKVAKCRTTTPDPFFENQYPMEWGVADGESNYEALAIPGTVAIVCLGGIEDASYGPPQFQPYAMGVRRHMTAAPGQTVDGVNVVLNVPMDRRFRVWLDDPPHDTVNGPDTNALLIYYDFASDGVIGQDWALPLSFGGNEVVAEYEPRAFTGDLYDVTYTFMAAAFTVDWQAGQLQTPYSMSLRKGVSELDDDILFRLDGGTWSVVRTGVRKDVLGMWGLSGTQVFAVGADGLVWFWDGFGFTQQAAPAGGTLRAVHGAAADDAWAVGDGGRVVRYDGIAWKDVPVQAALNRSLRGVSCAAKDDCWAVGSGFVMQWDGMKWAARSDVMWADWQGVLALGGGEAVAVGSGGRAVRVAATGVADEPTGVGYTLRAVARDPSGVLWAAGDGGTLVRSSTPGKWEAVPTGTKKALYALAVSGERVFAVGDTGTIVRHEAGVATASRIEGFGPHLRCAYADPAGPGKADGTGGAAVIAMGVSQLVIGPFLPVPEPVHPTRGGLMKTLSIDFKADPGIPASLHYLKVDIPGLFGDIPVWTLFVAGDTFHVDLPDFGAMEGMPGIPQETPLKLTIFRIYKPGVDIDHFDYSDLDMLEASTWSVEIVNFVRP